MDIKLTSPVQYDGKLYLPKDDEDLILKDLPEDQASALIQAGVAVETDKKAGKAK